MCGPKAIEINWRTYKGLAGDLQTMLVGEYNGVVFSELYDDFSIFNFSMRRTKRKITGAIMMLHANHWLECPK